MTRLTRCLAALALLTLAVPVVAQNVQQTGAPNANAPAPDPTRKKALSSEDYSRWRTIEGAQISSDGKYAAYVFRQMNVPQADSKPVLHIVRLDDDNHVTVANASQPLFSPDGRFIAYQVEPPRAAAGRGGRGGGADSAASDSAGRGRAGAPATPQRRMELRELATGATKQWQDMASATFNNISTHVLFRRTAGAGAGGGRGGANPPAGGAPLPPAAQTSVSGSGVQTATPRGAEVILHNLGTGRSLYIGGVGDASFNRKGDLLAYSVDGAVRDGNGVFLIDLPTGRTLPLDNDSKTYNRLTWNDDGTSLAILKGTETPRMRGAVPGEGSDSEQPGHGRSQGAVVGLAGWRVDGLQPANPSARNLLENRYLHQRPGDVDFAPGRSTYSRSGNPTPADPATRRCSTI